MGPSPRPVPTLTSACTSGDHTDCPHRLGFIGLHVKFDADGKKSERTTRLCRCSCHETCPLTSHLEDPVSELAWRQTCTCSGAPADWLALDERRARRTARRVEDREVLHDVQIGPGASRESISAQLAAALQERHLVWSQEKIDLTIDALVSTTGNRWLVAPRAFRAFRRAFRSN
jgi:hypothetical protein